LADRFSTSATLALAPVWPTPWSVSIQSVNITQSRRYGIPKATSWPYLWTHVQQKHREFLHNAVENTCLFVEWAVRPI
jgi:hypothetical protein